MSGDLFLVVICQLGLKTPIHAPTVFSVNLIPLTLTYDLHSQIVNIIYTHTHPFNGPLSGTTQVSRYQKGKTNLDFTEARECNWHRLRHMQVCT